MGNCLRSESTMVWAGDDWGSLGSKSHHHHHHHNNTMQYSGVDGLEKQRLLHEIRASSSSTNIDGGASRELKIKITKKELDQLVARTGGMQGLTVEQFLSQLVINNGGGVDHRPCAVDHQRSWRPGLQSIPEVN